MDYLQIREANIAENRAEMLRLGLVEEKPKKAAVKRKKAPTPAPSRQSSRVKEMPKVNYDDDWEVKHVGKRRKVAAKNEKVEVGLIFSLLMFLSQMALIHRHRQSLTSYHLFDYHHLPESHQSSLLKASSLTRVTSAKSCLGIITQQIHISQVFFGYHHSPESH